MWVEELLFFAFLHLSTRYVQQSKHALALNDNMSQSYDCSADGALGFVEAFVSLTHVHKEHAFTVIYMTAS